MMTPEQVGKMSPQECVRWLQACEEETDKATPRYPFGIINLLKVPPGLKLRPVSDSSPASSANVSY